MIQPRFGSLAGQVVGLSVRLQEGRLNLGAQQRVADGDGDGEHPQNQDQGHPAPTAR